MRTANSVRAGIVFGALALASLPAFGQSSPAAETSATVGGKAISIKYSAPSVRGRQIFGPGGLVSKDSTAPVWRTGANAATALHTEADLQFGSLSVPKGDYTLFTLVDSMPWQLIVNKQTGMGGLEYDAKQDLGRVKMTMSKPPTLVEKMKMTLASTGAKAGTLRIEWENTVATIPFTVK